jgi:predicted ABC-type transport system involved in lysophospholipase L1 biosynthesis ATPase subunit
MVQSSLARLVQAAIPISKSLTGAANVLRGDKKVVELTDAAASHVRQLLTNGGRVSMGIHFILLTHQRARAARSRQGRACASHAVSGPRCCRSI